jgi:flagellar basal body-associated protein FliL
VDSSEIIQLIIGLGFVLFSVYGAYSNTVKKKRKEKAEHTVFLKDISEKETPVSTQVESSEQEPKKMEVFLRTETVSTNVVQAKASAHRTLQKYVVWAEILSKPKSLQ